MIHNKVFRSKGETTLPFSITLKKDDELHIVEDVVYCNGFPLPFEMQGTIYQWLLKNGDKFIDDTRTF